MLELEEGDVEIPINMKTSNVTLNQLVSKQNIIVNDNSKGHLSISFNHYNANFSEVARADFDGDGCEDIWIYYAYHDRDGGSFRFYGNLILSRRKANDIFVVKQIR